MKFSELKSLQAPHLCALASGMLFVALDKQVPFCAEIPLKSQGNKGGRGGLKALLKLQLIGPGVHRQPVITLVDASFN